MSSQVVLQVEKNESGHVTDCRYYSSVLFSFLDVLYGCS